MPKNIASNTKKQSKVTKSESLKKNQPVPKPSTDLAQEFQSGFGFSNFCDYPEDDNNDKGITDSKEKTKPAQKVSIKTEKDVTLKPTQSDKSQSDINETKEIKKNDQTRNVKNEKGSKKAKVTQSKPKVSTRSRSVVRIVESKKNAGESRRDQTRSRSRSVTPKAENMKSKVKVEESEIALVKSDSITSKHDAKKSEKTAKKEIKKPVVVIKKALPEKQKKIKKLPKESSDNVVQKAPRKSTLKAMDKIQIAAVARHPRSLLTQTSTSLNRKDIKNKLDKAIKTSTLKSVQKKLKEPLAEEKLAKKDTLGKAETTRKTSTKAGVKQIKKNVEVTKPKKVSEHKDLVTRSKKMAVEPVTQHKLKKTTNKKNSKDEKKEKLKETFENENREITQELEANLTQLKTPNDRSKSPNDIFLAKKQDKPVKAVKKDTKFGLLVEKEEVKLTRNLEKSKRANRMKARIDESEDRQSLTQNSMISEKKDSDKKDTKKANNTRLQKKMSPTKAFANPTQTSTRSKKLASPKVAQKPALTTVTSSDVPVVKKKKTRSKARAIDRKVNQVLRATTRNRSKATQNIKIKEADTNAFLDNMATKTQNTNTINNRPVIIQQKIEFPSDDIKQQLSLMKEKVQNTKDEKNTPMKVQRNLGLFASVVQAETAQIPDLGKKDNISLAILRGLQKVGTKGLFKKIVSWAELNYREEVVSSIMSEFGLRSRNKNKFNKSSANKPTELHENNEDSENDEDIINNMRNAMNEGSESNDNLNREERIKNLFDEGIKFYKLI